MKITVTKDNVKIEKFDIVHAHGTRAMSNVFWAAKKAKLPVIYTVHGWSFHPNQNILIRKIRELSENFLTSKADTTICVSKSNENDGIKLFNMKRSRVIYNSVDLEKFNPNKKFKDIRKELGISENLTVIGYIVRMTIQKDPLTMIRAMKIMSEKTDDVVLLMIGDGELKADAIKLATDLNVKHKIIFENFRSDIPDVLNIIDIYCLPSLWEGFPIGILETMAMKKSVVCTPVNGNIELVTNNETGLLVEIGNPELLAEALLSLHYDRTKRNNLAQKGYELVTNNFGIAQSVDKIEFVYTDLVSKTTKN